MTTLDQAMSLRLPVELRHRVERRCVEMNTRRQEVLERHGKDSRLAKLSPSAFTFSDVIRRALDVGLAVLEGNEDAIRDWAGPIIESDLKRILAAGCHDSKAMKLLQRIASKSAPEPDFG